MILCASCVHSRWIHTRFGRFARPLEWLTGWLPYRCLACGTGGWHRSRQTPPSIDFSRQVLQELSRRAPVVKKAAQRVHLRTAGVVVILVMLGGWVGTLLWSRSPRTDGERQAPAQAHAQTIAPVATSGVSAVARNTPPPVVPPAGPVVPPAVDVQHAAAPVTDNPADTPSIASKPLPRAAALAQSAPQRARATTQPVRPSRAVGKGSGARVAGPASTPRYHGSLAVRSEPVGALVSVDGRVVGVTPILLKAVPAGSRVVRIESQGYGRWSSAARVVADRETSVVATLQRGPAQ